MNLRELTPWGRESRDRSLAPSGGSSLTPFMSLQREMNRLFDDVFRGFDLPTAPAFMARGGWPSVEVDETDQEYRVSAELPGLDQNDVEVTFDDGVLSIRGEKRMENEDRARAFSERYYGRFERRIGLDRDVEQDNIRAEFRNGVLTVTVPKSAQAAQRGRRIPINQDQAQTSH